MAVPYPEAVSLIHSYLEDRAREEKEEIELVSLSRAVGRKLARDYRATVNAPPFDNSGEQLC
jgi:molybdopterin biosynthesis enzyme